MSHSHTFDPAVALKTTGRVQNVGLWILQVAAAAMFLMSGFFKLAGAEQMVAVLEAVGVGQWFRYLTGVMEVGGAVLLLVPALAGMGALVLAAVMAGAIFTHLFLIGGSPLMPIALLAVLGTLAYGRRSADAAAPGALKRPPSCDHHRILRLERRKS